MLCFGGVKNGLAVGEAVLFFDRELAREFEWRVKQAGHLNSKMRLVTAPWLALLENGVWLENARHANAMAQRLWERIRGVEGVRLMAPVQSNGVFVELPVAVQASMREQGWRFYTFLGETGCRLMCAWDTTPATVDRFAADLADCLPLPACGERVGVRGSGYFFADCRPLIGTDGAENLLGGAGQCDGDLAVGGGNLERTHAHADLLLPDAEQATDTQHYTLDLAALAQDQVVDGADGLAVGAEHLGAEQTLLGQILARRLALEEDVLGDFDFLGCFRLGLVLFLGQGRHGKHCRDEKCESQLVHLRSSSAEIARCSGIACVPPTRQGR